MHIAALIAGIFCLVYALLDAFQTVVLPRRATGRFRLTRLFYLATWRPWSWFSGRVRDARRRETALSVFGPLSLVLLIVLWALALIVGFALIFYALHSPFHDPLRGEPDFSSDLYVSGTTLFTLGMGDLVPHANWVRRLVVLEAGIGLGFVAVVIGYFPVLYGAFSRREVTISLLDARSGSPPTAAELLKRHAFEGGNDALTLLLEEWERWSAELLESHISYPLLCYFRSQHSNQSWLAALTAVLDTCSLLIAGVQGHPARQAQLTFAMARHALVDLAQVFSLKPMEHTPDRMPESRYRQMHDSLCQSGVLVCRDGNSLERLRTMRAMYEGHAEVLSQYLCMPLPPFMSDRPHKDNWMTVARLRAQKDAAIAEPPVPAVDDGPVSRSHAVVVAEEEEHHIF